VKINCVPVRGYNEEEIVSLAALAKGQNIAVRFIELIPLGSAANFQCVSGGAVASLLEKNYGTLTRYDGTRGNGPAVYYRLSGFSGTIGFINAISRGFCESCNRLRLTSEGFLKLCLSVDMGLDLRKLLRNGASDDEISAALAETVSKKPAFHNLSGIYGVQSADSESNHSDGMFKIGG
jgi:cyclic pyranopterin phosphate synthase